MLPIVLILVLGTVALTAVFWALALVVQGYLYNQPADKLPLRAALAGFLVAAFVAGWAYVNTRASHKDKYGTLFTFTSDTVREVTEFDAVRQFPGVKDEKGQPKELTTKFKWQAGGKAGRFLDPTTGKDFTMSDSSAFTVAVVVPDGDGKTARFNAGLKGGGLDRGPNGQNAVVFTEEGGSRWLTEDNLHLMTVPSGSAFVWAVAINVLHFVVWFVALWPVLRFNSGAALGLAAIFGATTMLVAMPLLFEKAAV